MSCRRLSLILLLLCSLRLYPQEAHSAAETHLGRGYEALKLDRYDDAVKEFRAALAADPALVERAQFPLAVALFEQHKPEEARRELEAVRRSVGDHPNLLYYLGRIELDVRNFAVAVEDLLAAAKSPPFPDTYYYLGFAYLKANQLDLAEKWLKKAEESTPRDARVPYQLGVLYQKLGREEESKKWLAISDEIRKRDDRDSQIKQECARELDAGKREQAHQTCQQLYDDTNAERLMTLGTIYAQHGDPQAALRPLQRAAELAPQSPQMQYNLALAYFQMNQFQNARGPLETALQRWPDLFQLNFLYGAVLLNLGEDDAAERVLRHAHDLNPQDATTDEMLAAVLMSLAEKDTKAGRNPEAVTKLQEAAALSPTDPAPHRRLSLAFQAMGNAAAATSERNKADELSHH